MKKLLTLALCLILCTFVNAQTYSVGHIHITVVDTMYHDSTECNSFSDVKYYFNIDSSYTGEVIKVIDTLTHSLMDTFINTTGASPWIFNTILYSTSSMDYYLTGGYAHFYNHVTKVTCGADTLRYIAPNDSLLVTNPCLYDTISGRVYIDNNNNCVFDAGDAVLNSSDVTLTENLSGIIAFFTWGETGGFPMGYWNLPVQKSWMVDYQVNVPPNYAFIFPFSSCYTAPAPYTTSPMGGIDFPLQCTHNVDVQTYALSPGSVRLHTPFYMDPYVSNTGCDMASGTMTLVLDSRVIYNPSLSTFLPDTVRGDTLIWNYNNLTNLSGGGYWNSFFSDIYLTPDTTLVVGDTLCFRVYTNVPPMDIDPSNNDYSFCLPVVYSYDPNLKEVTPTGTGPMGYIPPGTDTLSYNVHFQNTGTAAAYTVKVIDTLDSHINAQTLRVLGTTHPMSPTWLSPNVVQFEFDNINLPDSSSNEAASHGEVRFSVVLNAGLAAGTQIKNRASIYFDLNPPVVTNTTLNTIRPTTYVSHVAPVAKVKVYPNPATDFITAENLNGGELSILNMDGVNVLSQQITSDKTSIDISRLPGGVYILKTVNNTGATTTKFTKY